MNRKHRLIAACLTFICATSASKAYASSGRDLHNTIQVDSQLRRYDIHLPQNYHGQSLPLVIVLHCGLGSRFTAKLDTGLSDRADRLGFITVYPEGTAQLANRFFTWNAGACCGRASQNKVDDVAFIRKLVTQLKSDYNIDGNRIFVMGTSNGGMLAYRLAAELSDVFAAIASVEGCLVSSLPEPEMPVSVIVFHGTRDRIVPYAGGTGSLFGYKFHCASVGDAVSFWAQHDGCRAGAEHTQEGDLTKDNYSNGKNGTEVCLYTFNGGHLSPHACSGFSYLVNPRARELTTDLICDFFLSHPKSTHIVQAVTSR